jgi:hypothetical protein
VPELQLAVLRWFNRHLKGEEKPPVEMAVKRFFTPEQLRVFNELPTDAVNTNIAESFVPTAQPQKRSATDLAAVLRDKVFANWPREDLPLDPVKKESVERDGLRLSVWDFTSQHDVALRLYLVENVTSKEGRPIRLQLLDEKSSAMWLHNLRAGFGVSLADEPADTSTIANIVSPIIGLKQEIKNAGVSLAWFAPRGVGMTAWSGDEKARTKIRRRFMLLGQTLDSMRVWDIRRAVQMIHFVRDADVAKVEIQAGDKMAVNAMYAALFEPSVRKLELRDIPTTREEMPDYLGVLRVTDLPEVTAALGEKIQTPLR